MAADRAALSPTQPRSRPRGFGSAQPRGCFPLQRNGPRRCASARRQHDRFRRLAQRDPSCPIAAEGRGRAGKSAAGLCASDLSPCTRHPTRRSNAVRTTRCAVPANAASRPTKLLDRAEHRAGKRPTPATLAAAELVLTILRSSRHADHARATDGTRRHRGACARRTSASCEGEARPASRTWRSGSGPCHRHATDPRPPGSSAFLTSASAVAFGCGGAQRGRQDVEGRRRSAVGWGLSAMGYRCEIS